MNLQEMNICRLCLNKIGENYQATEHEIRGLLNNLFFISISEQEIICNSCSEKVIDIFNFKARCLYIEDEINDIINSKNTSQVDLKDIYVKVKDDKSGRAFSGDEKICRLCVSLEIGGFKKLDSTEEEITCIRNMIQNYIPEVNLRITENPIVCEYCYDFLKILYNFIKNFVCVKEEIKGNYHSESAGSFNDVRVKIKEEYFENGTFIHSNEFIRESCTDGQYENVIDKIKRYAENDERDIPVTTTTVKNEEIEITPEAKQHARLPSRNRNRIPTDTVNEKSPEQNNLTPDMTDKSTSSDIQGELKENLNRSNLEIVSKPCFKCTVCGTETKHKRSLTRHMMRHKNPEEVNWFSCELCDFKTIRKTSLKIHMWIHDDKPPKAMFTCELCGHNTGHKHSLKTHMLTHRNRTEVKMHKCSFCDFETRWSFNLKNHMLTHSDPSEIRTYNCDSCDFKTFRKYCLKMHSFVHDPSQLKVLTCDICGHTTKWKSSLKKHMLTHEVKTYQCTACDFQTHRPKALETHRLTHSERPTYDCELCRFTTERKYNLKRHALTHEVPAQLKTLTCDVCGHKTKYKSRLRIHMLTHSDPLEIKTHRCDICDFVTRERESFKLHLSTHLDDSEARTYKCNLCEFKTNKKSDLKGHVSKHENVSEIKTFKCETCGFQTKRKYNLKNHLKTHKDPSEIETYKCENCSFETWRKSTLTVHENTHLNRSTGTAFNCEV